MGIWPWWYLQPVASYDHACERNSPKMSVTKMLMIIIFNDWPSCNITRLTIKPVQFMFFRVTIKYSDPHEPFLTTISPQSNSNHKIQHQLTTIHHQFTMILAIDWPVRPVQVGLAGDAQEAAAVGLAVRSSITRHGTWELGVIGNDPFLESHWLLTSLSID